MRHRQRQPLAALAAALAAAARLALLLLLVCEAHEDDDMAQLATWQRHRMEASNTSSAASRPLEDPVDLVRVVFSSHLDVGYTNREPPSLPCLC